MSADASVDTLAPLAPRVEARKVLELPWTLTPSMPGSCREVAPQCSVVLYHGGDGGRHTGLCTVTYNQA